MIDFVINGNKEENIGIIKTWFYGHYFHEDEDKKNKLNALDIALPLYRFYFVTLIEQFSLLAIILLNNAKVILETKK